MAAGVVVGGLLFNVNASTADFEKAMKRVQKKFDDMGKQVSAFGAGLTKAFAPATAAITALSVAGSRYANTLEDVSSKLKMNSEALQVMRLAAQEGSVSNERLEKGLRNITDRTLLAAQGNKSYREAIEAIGYSTEAFLKLPTERKFEAIGRAYANATDKAKAHEAVMKLVGTMSGPELIKTLEAVGIEGFDALAIRARAAGVVLSQEATQRISDFVGKIDQLKIRLQVLGAEIANRLIKNWDALNARLGVTDKIEKITKWFGNLSDETKDLALGFTLLGAAAGPVIFMAGKMISAFAPMLGIATKIVVGIKGIGAAVGLALGPVTAIIGGIVAATAAVFAFTGALDGIGKSLIGERLTLQLKIFSANLLKTAVEWGAKMLIVIVDLDRYLRAAIGTGFAWVVHQFQNGLIEKIGKAVEWAWGAWTGLWEKVGSFLYDAFTGAFDLFLNDAKKGLNVLIGIANKLPGVDIGKIEVDDNLGGLSATLSAALERATAPFMTALRGGIKDADGGFDFGATFKSAMGEGDSIVGGAIKGLAGKMTDGMQGTIDKMQADLDGMKKPVENVASSSDKLTAAFSAATDAVNANTKVEYSDDAKKKAQDTLDLIDAGKLSTTKATRLEAEAILRGDAISGESARFRKFASGATPATPAFTPPIATAATPAATVSPAAQQAQQQQQGDAKGGGEGGLVGAINALIQAITNGNASLTQTIATAFPA